LTKRLGALVGDPICDGNGRNPPRLRHHDVAVRALPRLDVVVQDELTDLRGFTATGVSPHDNDWVFVDGFHDLCAHGEGWEFSASFHHGLEGGVVLLLLTVFLA